MSKTTEKPKKHTSAQEHSATFTHRQRTLALVVVSMGFVIDLLDNTIVNVAIPTIQSNLGASYAMIQWILAGYAMTFALLLITGGRMGDVFGYKKLFLGGVAGFTLASLLSGLAVNPTMLVVSRLFQGSMAALMVPQVMSLMQVMYKPEERGAINGLFGALGGLAASLGPVIGGLLIKVNVAGLSWRPLFLINIPVGILTLLAGFKYLPDGKSSHPLKLDLVGTGIVLVAMTLLVFPLIQGRELGWPLWAYLMLAASIPAFAIFAKWQKVKNRRDGSPLIAPSLFEKRSFAAGLGINMIFEAAMLGFFLTFTLVLQIGLGFSAIHAALTGLPVALGIGFTMATFGQKVIPALGRRAIWIGTTIMSLGLFILSLVLHHYAFATASWQLIPGQLMVGIGMGFVFASLFAVVLSGVDVKHAGSASGILNAIQQVGGAIGIALIGVVFFGQLNHAAANSFNLQAPELSHKLTALHVPVDVQGLIIARTKQCFVDRSHEKDSQVIPASCVQKDLYQNKAIGDAITSSALKANSANFNHAFKYGMVFEVSLLALVFGLSWVLPKRIDKSAYAEAF
ncbi:MAG: drug resistance transporter, EmrB/QacA subfamily [Candidatus Saccharibacteria bacterium]|nr:drug resistance transporter, EmrB/QacA subfamily [Candidatus Saccharibacteria bacterium]